MRVSGQSLILQRRDAITYELRESNGGDRSALGSAETRCDHVHAKGEQRRRQVSTGLCRNKMRSRTS